MRSSEADGLLRSVPDQGLTDARTRVGLALAERAGTSSGDQPSPSDFANTHPNVNCLRRRLELRPVLSFAATCAGILSLAGCAFTGGRGVDGAAIRDVLDTAPILSLIHI